jgi:2-polyprenyl-3-methyl-5-hydroxy-6-metoxy-1,4-benzoquinol methylase
MLETIPSPIQPNEVLEPADAIPDRFALEDGDTWKLVRAATSGLLFLNPRPDANTIASHYEALDYDPFITLKKNETLQDKIYKFARRYITLRWKARAVLSRMNFIAERAYNVLEIGCATGDFLTELARQEKSAHLDLYGIEFSANAARFAREENELRVCTGELLSCDLTQTFDLIAMWHVLEHVLRLNDTLDKLHRVLKPNGTLVVAMPNPDSYDARHFKKFWNGYDAPRHLYHFTPKTFAKLLSQHGFVIREMHALPLDSYYNALISQQIVDKAKKQTSGLGTWLKAIWHGSVAAAVGKDVASASSVVYYIVKKTS